MVCQMLQYKGNEVHTKVLVQKYKVLQSRSFSLIVKIPKDCIAATIYLKDLWTVFTVLSYEILC